MSFGARHRLLEGIFVAKRTGRYRPTLDGSASPKALDEEGVLLPNDEAAKRKASVSRGDTYYGSRAVLERGIVDHPRS